MEHGCGRKGQEDMVNGDLGGMVKKGMEWWIVREDEG